jgi:hypothetical protein
MTSRATPESCWFIRAKSNEHRFPELMAAAIRREEIGPRAAARGIVTARGVAAL